MPGRERLAADLPTLAPAEAADHVGADAVVAVSGFGSVGYPKAVPLALAEADRELGLTIISGGAVGDEIDTELAEAGAIARRHPYATRPAIRRWINEGPTAFRDRHVSGIADDVRFGGLPSPDVAIVEAIAVGEGWLVPSTSIGQTPAFVETADALIVEVNRAQPRELGDLHDIYTPADPPDREPIPLEVVDGRIGTTEIGFDPGQLVGVVETDRPDQPYAFREPTPADSALGDELAGFLAAELGRNPALRGSFTFEVGVGSVGNALLGALGDVAFDDRAVRYFGEVIQDGLLDAIDDGLVDAASGTALALSADGQRRLFDGLDRYAERLVLRPAEVSNRGDLIDRFGVVAINAAVEVDLYGHVNSTHVAGSQLVGGLGGSGDFARHALLSIVACPSTARDGAISRIVPFASHVDHPEHDVDVVVTEQGVADLRGTDPRESAERLVAVAHPSVRADLRRYRERAEGANGHLPHDLPSVFDWRRWRPEA